MGQVGAASSTVVRYVVIAVWQWLVGGSKVGGSWSRFGAVVASLNMQALSRQERGSDAASTLVTCDGR